MIFPDISGILVILSTFLIAFSQLLLKNISPFPYKRISANDTQKIYKDILKNSSPSIALSGHIALDLNDGERNNTQLNKKRILLSIKNFFEKQILKNL